MAIEKKVRLSLYAGLHGRPGVLIQQLAGQYPGQIVITLRNGEKVASATSLVELLALAVGKGEEVTVRVEGKDEKLEEEVFKTARRILHGEIKRLPEFPQ